MATPAPSPTPSFNRLAPNQSGAIIDLPARPRALISMNHVMETGTVPRNGWLGTLIGNPDMRVDLKADDAYTQAIRHMVTQGIQKLQADPESSALLQKPEWTKADRAAWERSLAGVMAIEMHRTPGFDTYRTSNPSAQLPWQTGPAHRHPFLNRLTQDIIAPGNEFFEFDCEQMSVTLGLAMQMAENKLLPPAQSPDTLRAAQPYYFAGGSMHELIARGNMTASLPENLAATRAYGHALLVSGATGNFIEATNNSPRPDHPNYHDIKTPGYGFQSLVSTGVAVLDSQKVFSDVKDPARALAAREEDHLINWCVGKLDTPSSAPPEACQTPAVQAALKHSKPVQPN
jgi:hypothetical protein